ncbi:putative reverse transcriptase domain-containing protein [Tanacetum coccineum]
MICVIDFTAVFDNVNVEMQSSKSCMKCLDLDAELLNKQNAYNDLSKSYSQLEKHCISLELTMQLNQGIFQKNSLSNNQNAIEIPEYFKNNDLKALLQAKDITICKLKEHIKSMRDNDKEEKVKHEMDDIETINNELEHIAQLNSKSLENADLKAQFQEKVFGTTALQSELKRLKGKHVLDNVTTMTNATTIAPGMFKLDIEPLSHRLKNNRDTHDDYLKNTIENTNTICVPDCSLDHGTLDAQQIQEPLSAHETSSKDEAPDAIIKCIKYIQVRLNATVCDIRTDNGTEFVNQTLQEFYENVSITHQTSFACTPNRTALSSGPELQSMTPATSSSALVSNPVPQQPFNPLTRNDWGLLFQPMFDEYFNPPSSSVSLVPVATAPRAVDLVDSPSSTTIDQDAPSSSTSSTNQEQQSSIISQVIMEYLVNISKRRAFWSLNGDILKITILSTNTPYLSRKIRRIRACTHQRPLRKHDQYAVSREDQYAVLEIMDDSNITMEEYIRLEEEKAQNCGKVFNWETTKYGKIWYDEDVHDLISVETKFPAIAFNDQISSEKTPFYEPTVSSLNDEIDFKISFDDSDDEDYTENDNEKVNMPSFPSPEPTVSYFDDLDFFKDFENEFPAIVYSDAPMSKSDLLTEPILSPQHIDEFDLKDEISLFECDEEEQNILNINDLFPFNVIYPNDSKLDKDNDDDKVDIEHFERLICQTVT